MTTILLCSHGGLAAGVLDAAQMIAGVGEGVEAVSLTPGKDPATLREELSEKIDAAEGDVLCFVDLFGGTPSNVAASLSMRDGVEVVAGLNLPALIEVATRRDTMALSELKELALQAIGDSAVDVKQRFADILKKRQEG